MTSKKSLRPSNRLSALRTQQTRKMARSAHAYVRGSTVKFYEWLEAQKRGKLKRDEWKSRRWFCQRRLFCSQATLEGAPGS